MNYNPYAAPSAGPLPPLAHGYGNGGPQPWDPAEVLSASWEAFQRHAPVLVGACVVYAMVLSPLGGLPLGLTMTHTLEPGPTSYLLQAACFFGNLVLDAFMTVGLFRITLDVARGKEPSFADVFSGASHFLPMLGVAAMTRLILVLGCCSFGFIPIYMGLCFAGFYVVDQDLGPIDAMNAAWRATDGQHGEVLVYSLLALAVYVAGIVLCGVGVLASGPIVMLGFAIIYLRISGRGVPGASGSPGP